MRSQRILFMEDASLDQKNPAVGREVNQGARVVKDLVKEIEHSSRNITCDNF